MTDINQPAPISKRIILIVGVLLVIGAIGAGAITLLRTILPKSTTDNAASSAVLSPTEVIAAFKTPGTIKGLEESYQEQSNQTGAQIIYTSEGRKYAISVSSKHTALFYAKATGQTNDQSLIQEQSTAFITSKGYEKTANTGQATSENPAYLTFKSAIGVCQLVSAQPTNLPNSHAYYLATCADSTAINQEYSTTEMLLTLYKNANEAPRFTMASRINQTEDNKQLSVVSLSGEGKPLSLLFAAIDNNWEYIGDLSDTSSGESSGKYTISAEMRGKINDARYGDFLRRFIK